MTAEQIYAKLKDSDMPEEGEDGGWNFGGVDDQKTVEGGQVSEAQAKAIEAELNSRITQAAAVAKKAGLLPGGLETEIGELLKPKVRWEDVLADFVDAYAKNDYSYAKLSRSAMQRGMIMPGLRSNELGHVLLIGDTSGSTYDCFNEFLTEMFGILDAYECEVTILAVDTSVYDVGNFRAGDFPEPKELKFKGGGGTSFEKITPYLHKHGIAPTVGVLFTDGYVCDWGADPGFPMLIASNGSMSGMPDWANRVIKL
jgi:predicted metal-dependent peptidase